MTIYDGEAPVLKNLPAQDLDVTVHECVAPSANLVISADNDPSFAARGPDRRGACGECCVSNTILL